jgi:hypothetical protein
MKDMIFQKFKQKSDSNSNLNSVLNKGPTNGCFLLADIGSGGLRIRSVGLKEDLRA